MVLERAGEVGGGAAGRVALSATARWRALVATAASALGRTLGTAVGVGALAGAGQLGIGYGLGLLHYQLPLTGAVGTSVSVPALTSGVWASQRTWLAWFAALAVLAGALSGNWMARRQTRGLAPGGRAVVAVAAGIGAAVVMPLAALPARSALLVGRTESVQPALEAVLAAGLGLVIGILAAFAALTLRLVALSLTLLVGAAWLLALVSVAPSLGPDADLPDVRLGVLDLPALGGARSTVAVLSAPLLALLVCGAIAWAARVRGLPPLQTAVSAAAAPGLLALTYLIGSPGTGERATQVPAYAGSLIALAAGLLVALLVGAVRLPSSLDAEDDLDEPPGPDAGPAAGEPTATGSPLSAPGSPVSAAGSPVSAPGSPESGPGSPGSPISPAELPAWPAPATSLFSTEAPESGSKEESGTSYSSPAPERSRYPDSLFRLDRAGTDREPDRAEGDNPATSAGPGRYSDSLFRPDRDEGTAPSRPAESTGYSGSRFRLERDELAGSGTTPRQSEPTRPTGSTGPTEPTRYSDSLFAAPSSETPPFGPERTSEPALTEPPTRTGPPADDPWSDLSEPWDPAQPEPAGPAAASPELPPLPVPKQRRRLRMPKLGGKPRPGPEPDLPGPAAAPEPAAGTPSFALPPPESEETVSRRESGRRSRSQPPDELSFETVSAHEPSAHEPVAGWAEPPTPAGAEPPPEETRTKRRFLGRKPKPSVEPTFPEPASPRPAFTDSTLAQQAPSKSVPPHPALSERALSERILPERTQPERTQLEETPPEVTQPPRTVPVPAPFESTLPDLTFTESSFPLPSSPPPRAEEPTKADSRRRRRDKHRQPEPELEFESKLEPKPGSVPVPALAPDLLGVPQTTPDPAEETRTKRRLLGRKPKPSPEKPKLSTEPAPPDQSPEPAAPDSPEPTSPAAPAARAAPAPPRPKRRGEVEHVDWISSLSDRSEEEPEPEKVRRRLRRDQELGTLADVPEPPTWPANDHPDDADRSARRSYVFPDDPPD